MRTVSTPLCFSLGLSLLACASDDPPEEPSRCEVAFERDRGCGNDRLFGLSFCEGAEREAVEAGCEDVFQTMLDCHVDADPIDCHVCDAQVEAVLGCTAETECQRLYYVVDDGCLDRAIEWSVADCDDYVVDPVTSVCAEAMLSYARCQAEQPYVDADTCADACLDELLDWADCEAML